MRVKTLNKNNMEVLYGQYICLYIYKNKCFYDRINEN